jgi:GTP cyclohydrolase I
MDWTTHAHKNISELLSFITSGQHPEREGLRETPDRWLKAWEFWSSGYQMKAEDVLKTFEDGAEKVNEIVVQTGIPIYSHCEHHLAPFWGVAHIGYIPRGRVVGLSKFKRLVDVFALRLQVQERLTQEIANAFQSAVSPLATGVILQCRHMCMEGRPRSNPRVPPRRRLEVARPDDRGGHQLHRHLAISPAWSAAHSAMAGRGLHPDHRSSRPAADQDARVRRYLLADDHAIPLVFYR